ncbi:MAG: hypothetical protein VKJ06_04880 [Vampirovibrionales bacterium]|nr:hypothetical protein [Vampirovibrionales bacterium]
MALISAMPKARVQALCVYGFVIIAFLSVIVIAVVASMAAERDKPGMRTITVEKPISFFDTTYMDENAPAKPAKSAKP